MRDATFAAPDLATFACLDELGLEVVGQRLEPDRTVLVCRVVEPDQWCRRCGCEGVARDTVTRRLAHEPFGWRPTTLEVTVHLYRCIGCGHVWRQDMSAAADVRGQLPDLELDVPRAKDPRTHDAGHTAARAFPSSSRQPCGTWQLIGLAIRRVPGALAGGVRERGPSRPSLGRC